MANSNKLKKYHYLYKTTNLLNEMFYIGVHSTNNLNDGYLGSGKRLRHSINKYGKENFKLEIIEFFDNRELLIEKEKEIVNDELINDINCFNLKLGGQGGLSSIDHMKKFSKAGNEAYKHRLKTDIEFRKKTLIILKNNTKKAHQNGNVKYDRFRGKKHTEESKIKMRKSKGFGEQNSQFGTIWITNGIENKKINKNTEIPKNWYKGRKIK